MHLSERQNPFSPGRAAPPAVSQRHSIAENSESVAKGGMFRQPPPDWAMPMLIFVGVALRLVQYVWNISYFHDEICLLWNIRAKTCLQFLGPLDHNQAAPPLFLAMERGIYLLFGELEKAMRVPAITASCLSIVLFAMLARRILSPWAALLAVWLLIGSTEVLNYSALLKPYAIDVLMAIAMSLWAIEFKRGDASVRWTALCIFSAMAVWMSYPVSLLFGGISLALLPTITDRRRSGWAIYGLGNLLVAASFYAMLTHVGGQRTRFMTESWDRSFLHLFPLTQVPEWLYITFFNLCNRSWKPMGVLVLPLAIAGAIWFARTDKLAFAILLGPTLMNLCAAAALRYPFDSGRLTLYLLPSVFILTAAGAVAIHTWIPPRFAWLGALPGLILCLFVTGVAARNIVHPPAFTWYRSLVAYVRERSQETDIVYSPFCVEFQYYWPEIGDRVRVNTDYADQIPSNRFWIAWSNPTRTDKLKLQKMRAWAKTFAVERAAYSESDNYAYFYEIDVKIRPHTVEPLSPR